ncbi:hypothetical protein [Bradyrhizobium stylosanthis]|uniref:hypothetical protein n=1 Tax=Bradyrhizobium stylosanthis TaxID=1803665 RepID=UPI001648ECF3|nr:hypothetical protein [Bradyrhizobium stylosanthis]
MIVVPSSLQGMDRGVSAGWLAQRFECVVQVESGRPSLGTLAAAPAHAATTPNSNAAAAEKDTMMLAARALEMALLAFAIVASTRFSASWLAARRTGWAALRAPG